jgi:hypothetical protein
VYFAGIIIAFFGCLILQVLFTKKILFKNSFKKFFTTIFKEKAFLSKIIFFAFWFLLPFVILKMYLGL